MSGGDILVRSKGKEEGRETRGGVKTERGESQ